MKAAQLIMPKKFRSVRDKSGSHRRNKSSEPGAKARPLTIDSWLSIFRPESAKQAQREKEVEEKEAGKVEEIKRKLEELNYHEITPDIIRYALDSKFAGGDVEKALELLQLQQQAFAGIIEPYNANVQMLGAVNRGNVTCYLDALLFAMFANLQAFECMLKNDSTDEAQRKLAALLRLWVNMLRSGKLIPTDVTQHIQESLAACGWKEAELLEQQDTSEAFAFITETLQLPLLKLQVDLFHQGKGDKDDHKVAYERLLNLAVPPDPSGKGIKLEDCLEEYFNNKVDVLRDSLEEKKGGFSTPKNTLLGTTEEDAQTPTDNGESSKLQRRWTMQETITHSPISMTSPTLESATTESPAVLRNRSTSIIQRIVVKDEEDSASGEAECSPRKHKRKISTIVKAVTIPAWQFFRLIPWHATTNSEPSNDAEVARHFNQRPVVGICLKRYTMTEQGVPKRQNTLIDIPDSLRLPQFMAEDINAKDNDSGGLREEFKLVLQSVVCHRGDSLHSGHYISFARVAPKLLTENRRYDDDPPPDYEEQQWAKFDDLAVDNRVTYVDDIKQSLREEMPYLLFYQVVPLVDVTTASTDGSVIEPPAYKESNGKVPATPIVESPKEPMNGTISRAASGFFDSATTFTQNSEKPSIRLSSEMNMDQRLSFDDDPYSINTKVDNSRRGSLSVSDSAAATAAITPEATSPAATTPIAAQEESKDESTAARLSRAAAKFKTGSKSRPTSQIGEGRLSSTISRLGFIRPSKDGSTSSNGSTAVIVVPSVDGVVAIDEQAVVTEEEASGSDTAKESKKEKGKEKEQHHHHLGYQHDRGKKEKDKGKKKDGEGDKKEKKEKGKGKEKDGLPERECSVM
ncbi:ubiquitin carboxyl-terminal hydrolase-domain-containing protein [Triangularia verruculosa]|uniref:ubiquitinyl hydrolase 1 n=1 Tax=Triangularia verruculosa TaxID=2587418 RepID=A0AAN6XP27_9PEZI|nr:ubiquitin carboxyl-terminal hydrolase-domain-containing protein [Triangularia verruculosa]